MLRLPTETPPGFVALDIGKGCVLVIPERVYLAGLELGKTLRRRQALLQRTAEKPTSQEASGSPIPPKDMAG